MITRSPLSLQIVPTWVKLGYECVADSTVSCIVASIIMKTLGNTLTRSGEKPTQYPVLVFGRIEKACTFSEANGWGRIGSVKEQAKLQHSGENIFGKIITKSQNAPYFSSNATVSKRKSPCLNRIRCPLCTWEPDGRDYWGCEMCGAIFDTFVTRAHCPECPNSWRETVCIRCHQMSSHDEWYVDVWCRVRYPELIEDIPKEVQTTFKKIK